MNELWKERWNLISKNQFAGFIVGATVFFFLLFKSEPGFMMILKPADTLFHEAGHPVVGMFSDRLCVYGGTMGQLFFPTFLMITFWLRREPVSVAAASLWFFENWLNISRYLADARQQMLPLIGGGCHDWTEILGRWHLTAYDMRIGRGINAVAFTGMALTVGWIVVLWFATATERADEIKNESASGDEMETRFKNFVKKQELLGK
jgi:hypothetical protein